MQTINKLALACIATFVSVPSHAITMTSVEIRNAFPTWLQVAEVEAYSGITNVAFSGNGGVATSSSVYSGGSGPANANDGVTGGNFNLNQIFHSGSPAASEYLLISFSAGYDVTLLNIYGRTDCCWDRDLYNFTAYNGQTVVASGQLDARNTHMAQVRFPPVSPGIPEPASWALLIVGFAMTGTAMRRRKAGIAVSNA